MNIEKPRLRNGLPTQKWINSFIELFCKQAIKEYGIKIHPYRINYSYANKYTSINSNRVTLIITDDDFDSLFDRFQEELGKFDIQIDNYRKYNSPLVGSLVIKPNEKV